MMQPTFTTAGEMLATSPLELSTSPTPIVASTLSPHQRSLRMSSTELRPLDMDELEPLSPADGHHRGRRSYEAGSSYPSSYASQSAHSLDMKRGPRSSTSSEHSSTSQVPFSARYITVSAVLSRSGAAIPIRRRPAADKRKRRRKDSLGRGEEKGNENGTLDAASIRLAKRNLLSAGETNRREASNGSALEALGALLLQRDSSGKVANLSFTRSRDNSSKSRQSFSRVSNAWLQGVREAGAARLGIRMPEEDDSGQTIAQRRARRHNFMFHNLFSRMSVKRVGDNQSHSDFTLVGTGYGQPTFEVSRVTSRHRTKEAIKKEPELPAGLKLPHHVYQPNDHDEKKSSVFGVGSAFAYHDPPDAPPSPIAMPGAWTIGGSGWRSFAEDWQEEGALLLPPPLLDDHGSDAKSFEGLLGVRKMREQQKASKELEKLKARNRPAHKVGMLTAFGNFVKAAHAADRTLKAASTHARSGRMPTLLKRHTEPIYARDDADAARQEDEDTAGEMSDADGTREARNMERSKSQDHKSPDSPERPLDIAFEGHRNSRNSNGNWKQSSASVSSRSSIHEIITPRAPRLLPIYMTTTYPNTPFVLDGDERGIFEMDRRMIPSEPPTPRLGPTLLSLPPSPWIHSSSIDEQRHSFSLQLSMQPVYGPPGAPRLAPTALEIAPSPYAMSPSSTPFARSPRQSASLLNGTSTPAEILSPLSLSPLRSPVLVATARHSTQRTARRTANGRIGDNSARMTPSSLINSKEEKVRWNPANQMNGKVQQKSLPKKERIFWLWFLFGDLGLKPSDSSSASISLGDSKAYDVFCDFMKHSYAFGIFVMAHLVDLTYHIADFLAMSFWFIRWMALNLTGQTVLARCVIEAYRLVQKEWQTVSLEDHEERGVKTSNQVARGLTRWQVVKGLIELVCLQDVTRDRYMLEGAGLEEIKGWQHKKRRTLADMQEGRVDLGAKRQADRNAVEKDGYEESDSSEDDVTESDDDDMVVTRQGPEILEFTKTPKIERKSYFGSFSSDGGLDLEEKVVQSKSEPVQNRALVKTIQWASRLAISAYGLHVTLVDLPATFTPSGDRFSRQTFAHLSRLHHEDVLHADIQTLDADAYSPTFYLVRDVARKVMVVSVRGTQSLQDIIVDLEMVVDQVELSDGEDNGTEKLYCHAGVLRAAKALLSRQSTLFRMLSEALEENEGFGIVFTGHSLGGAIASTVVLLLSKYMKSTSSDNNESAGKWVTHESSGLPAGRSIRAITFAHPATVNASLARRAGKGKVPLVLSIVLGSDIIPRCGHGQARELRRVLGALSRVRRRKSDHVFNKGLRSQEQQDARVHIVTSWWRWKQLKRKASSTSKEDLKRIKSIEDDLWSLRCDVENDLYAAVKQRSSQNIGQYSNSSDGEQQANGTSSSIYNSNINSNLPPSPWVGPAQRAKAPLHQLASRRQALDAVTLQNEESISASGVLVPAGQSILIYNNNLYRITSPLSFFSLPDFHPLMFADHFPSAYESALIELR